MCSSDLRRDELKFRSLERPLNGLAENLGPQAVRLPVIHHQRVHDEFARHSKGIFAPLDLAGIHDSRIAQRSPRHRDLAPADGVVDDLVPIE